MDEHNTTKVTVSSSEVWYSVKVDPTQWLQYGSQSVDRAVKGNPDVTVLNNETITNNYTTEKS